MADPTTTADFRVFLQSELVRRCRKNRGFSLRAFARMLELEPSELSKLLSGKRSFSRAKLLHLGERLALSPERIAAFADGLTERRGRPGPLVRSPKDETYPTLTEDRFQLVADWYHFAILELIAVEGFRPELRWIARALGITVSEARAAVERLQRIGLLEIDSDGTWHDRAANLTNIVSPGATSVAARLSQSQILAKAIEALDEVPAELRDQTGMVMAVDTRRLPEARARIARFRRELCAFLQESPRKDSVYQLGVALFPLTRFRSAPDKPKGRVE